VQTQQLLNARVDCVLKTGAIDVRLPLDVARKLAPRHRATVNPRAVRVW
jgi:hypothetical protein